VMWLRMRIRESVVSAATRVNERPVAANISDSVAGSKEGSGDGPGRCAQQAARGVAPLGECLQCPHECHAFGTASFKHEIVLLGWILLSVIT